MIEAIIFDNDGTLYRVEDSFREAVRKKFCEIISKKLGTSYAEAEKIQKRLSKKYGSTGAGVVKEFGWDYDAFVKATYLAIPIEKYVRKNKHLIKNLKAMPQKKIVVTNNPSKFAKKILERLGIAYYFDKVLGEEHFDFILKPKIVPYGIALKYFKDLNPGDVVMIEDSIQNLVTAKKLGMQTHRINKAGNLAGLKNGN